MIQISQMEKITIRNYNKILGIPCREHMSIEDIHEYDEMYDIWVMVRGFTHKIRLMRDDMIIGQVNKITDEIISPDTISIEEISDIGKFVKVLENVLFGWPNQ